MSRSRHFGLWWFLLAVVVACVVLAILAAIDTFIRPFDLAKVTITGDVPDVAFHCIIAENQGRQSVLDWYAKKVYFFTVPPSARSISGRSIPANANVRWVSAERYGVLTRQANGVWKIWWFDSGDIYDTSADGDYAFHITPETKSDEVDKAFLQALGLGKERGRAR